MVGLALVDFLGDFDDSLHATFEISCQVWDCVGFLLEYEGGQKGNYFRRFVRCEHVIQNEFREDELVGGMNLTGYFTFELDAGTIIDKFEIFENLDTLLVVGKELKVLIRHQLAELRNIFLNEPLVVTHCELSLVSKLHLRKKRPYMFYKLGTLQTSSFLSDG